MRYLQIHRPRLLSASLLALCVTGVWAAAERPNDDGELIPPAESDAVALAVRSIQGNVNAEFDKTGHAFRDAHRKAHGCVNATFTVLDNLPPNVAQGLFAKPQRYSAVIRYSNGSGQSRDDHSNDARGMALKVLGVPGLKILADEVNAHTQDFVMTNHPIFFIRDAPDYAQFQQALDAGGLRKVAWFAGHLFHETPIILAFTNHKVTNPLNVQYWSTTPSKLGTGQMKFSAKPCQGGNFLSPSDTVNLLSENLQSQLTSGSACFDVSARPTHLDGANAM